jgi:hypothetical protein
MNPGRFSRVRIALADPDGAQANERDALEQLGGTLPVPVANQPEA